MVNKTIEIPTDLGINTPPIDSVFLKFDPSTLNSTMQCGVDPGNPHLSGAYVLAEECTRFVYEHCVGKLRFFMILSGVLLICVAALMYKHNYWTKELIFIKKIFITVIKDIKNLFKKKGGKE